MTDSAPQPANILRGHKAQIHAISFVRGNDRLITGDADGFIVTWSLAIMRPVAVWKAHESAILSIQGWGPDKLITHGRDHKLIVWKLDEKSEKDLSSDPPLEATAQPRPHPWILHVLNVNAMNFCPFAACTTSASVESIHTSSEILVAVPNALISESVDIFQLPSQRRVHTVNSVHQNGMAMNLSLFYKDSKLVLVAGFENGCTSVHVLNEADQAWAMTYRNQTHSQPILSLDVQIDYEFYVASSADAYISKHPIPLTPQTVLSTKGKALTSPQIGPLPTGNSAEPSHTFAQIFASDKITDTFSQKAWDEPIKVVNTRHSGQQSLAVRSDGKIFTTAGWDSKIRVYSCKTVKELAVLQWHTVGVYAVSFAEILAVPNEPAASEASADSGEIVRGGQEHSSVKERRLQRVKKAHWLAAGAKDGKVSLWDIY